MRLTVVDYIETDHQFHLVAPTPELHQLARGLPAARERKKRGDWIIPASPATAARISFRYRKVGLEVTRAFQQYQLACIGAQTESWGIFQHLLDLDSIPITKVQPSGPWHHQLRAFWFAYPLEASLLDITMGGGKTKIAIDLLLNWRSRDVLIIAPLAAIGDAWRPHLDEHMVTPFAAADLDSGTLAARLRRAQELRKMEEPHRIAIINHESFWREPFGSWAASVKWDLVIADEIHREKSAGSMSSKFLHRLGMVARRRLGLTGTPMPHSPLDVYGQYRFLDRGIFGTNHARFLERYAEFGGYMGQDIVGFRRLAELRRKVYSIAIHIDDSAQGLPRTVDIKHSVQLEAGAKRAYTEMDREFITSIQSGEITAANSGVKLLRLHQLACGIAVTEDKKTHRISRAKLDGLRDVLVDLAGDEPAVVFVRFRPDIEAILEMCSRIRRTTSELSGWCNELSLWKAGQRNVLVAQIQAAKEGIDLTRASVGIFYSTGISLGDYLQCRKRLHRPPQKRMVRFVHILATGTKDVSTMRALEKRQEVIKYVTEEISR